MELINEKLLEMFPAIWIPKGHQLSHSTRLEEDLGMYGEDFENFIYEYMQKFKVDLSNFDMSKYISNELDPAEWIYFKFFPSKKIKKIKPLTIGDLEKGIIYKRLDDEIISKELY